MTYMSGDISVKDLREQLASVLNGLAEHGKAVRITRHGEPIAILMDHAAFEALLEDLDDADDYRALAEHDADADEATIAWELAARDLGVA